MINTTSERLRARNFFVCRYFSFYEQLKVCAQLSVKLEKSFITSGPDLEELNGRALDLASKGHLFETQQWH